MRQRGWQNMNQSSHRLGGCLRNSVLHRRLLLRSRDGRQFIFRQFLDTVSLPVKKFSQPKNDTHRGFRIPKTTGETSGRHSSYTIQLCRARWVLAKCRTNLKSRDIASLASAASRHTEPDRCSYESPFRARFFKAAELSSGHRCGQSITEGF